MDTRVLRAQVKLCVHPFTAAYLNRKIPTQPTRWSLKYRLRIRVEPDKKIPPTSYRFIDLRSGKDVTDLNSNPENNHQPTSKKKR